MKNNMHFVPVSFVFKIISFKVISILNSPGAGDPNHV